MKYPLRFTPVNKHDLHGPTLPLLDSSSSSLVLSSSSQLLELMEGMLHGQQVEYPPNSQLISTIYTYKEDAPRPEMGRNVVVLAYLETNHIGMMRRLQDELDDDNLDNSSNNNGSVVFRKGTWGVKRGDGDYFHRLDRRNQTNSKKNLPLGYKNYPNTTTRP